MSEGKVLLEAHVDGEVVEGVWNVDGGEVGAFGDWVPQLRDCAHLEGGTGYVKVEGREVYDHSFPSWVGSLGDSEEMGRITSL